MKHALASPGPDELTGDCIHASKRCIPHDADASSLCFDRAFKHRMHLMGVYLINVYLTGVHLMTVHLTGLHLMGVCLLAASDAKKIAMCPQGEGGFGNNCS